MRLNYRCANSNEPDIRPDVPLERVSWLIGARRKRAGYLPHELFGEPAWDMLLHLLRAELAHEGMSVSSACIAAGVPASTGLRWLKMFEEQGLVIRRCDAGDAEGTYVALSSTGSSAIRRYFLEVVGTPDPTSDELMHGVSPGE